MSVLRLFIFDGLYHSKISITNSIRTSTCLSQQYNMVSALNNQFQARWKQGVSDMTDF